jgi:hypothetical protein
VERKDFLRSYYYLRTVVDEPDHKKYFFQRQISGQDNGMPRSISLVKQNGAWLVTSANP